MLIVTESGAVKVREGFDTEAGWLKGVPGQPTRAYCSFCEKSLHAHRLSLLKHTCTLKHTKAAQKNFAQKSYKEEDVKPNMEGLGTFEVMMSQPPVTEVEIYEVVLITTIVANPADDDAARENESEFSHTAEESGEAPIIPKKRMVTLNEQVQIHSGKHSFLCDICNKAFRQKSNLIRHLRIHSGEQPYSCELCDKAFSQKSDLIRHQHIHSGEGPYSCEVCNKAFSRKSHLITHQRIHSGEHPYSCEVCNKAFSQKSDLIRHERIHSGEQSYSCEVCNKAFIRKSHLIIHQRIHRGEWPYSCEVCNKAFSQKSHLIRHQHIH